MNRQTKNKKSENLPDQKFRFRENAAYISRIRETVVFGL